MQNPRRTFSNADKNFSCAENFEMIRLNWIWECQNSYQRSTYSLRCNFRDGIDWDIQAKKCLNRVWKRSVKNSEREGHYGDLIMGAMASQITTHTIFYSTAYSGADQRKHQSSASLAFVRGIHRWPVNSPHPHKRPVTRNMFPFDDVIMIYGDCGPQTTLRTTPGSLHNRLRCKNRSAILKSTCLA